MHGRVETLQMQGVHAHLPAEHCEKSKKLDMPYPLQSSHAGDERTSLAFSEGL